MIRPVGRQPNTAHRLTTNSSATRRETDERQMGDRWETDGRTLKVSIYVFLKLAQVCEMQQLGCIPAGYMFNIRVGCRIHVQQDTCSIWYCTFTGAENTHSTAESLPSSLKRLSLSVSLMSMQGSIKASFTYSDPGSQTTTRRKVYPEPGRRMWT